MGAPSLEILDDPQGAIVLMSGGLDSCISATWAVKVFPKVAAIHASYGQRTQEKERESFLKITQALGITQTLEIDLSQLAKIGGSSLTDSSIEVSEADLESTEIPSSYVPFRNAHFLCGGVSWAEVLGYDHLVIGAVEEDGSGYPDCRREFYDSFEKTIQVGTKPETRLKIVTPLIRMSKAEIVEFGTKIHAPIESSWSCYQAESLACGLCDSCALRLRGFDRAGRKDPISYKTRPKY